MRRREFIAGGLGACALLRTAGAADSGSSDVRIHDPVMIREGGTYHLFGTGRGIAAYSSRDMRSWNKQPPVF